MKFINPGYKALMLDGYYEVIDGGEDGEWLEDTAVVEVASNSYSHTGISLYASTSSSNAEKISIDKDLSISSGGWWIKFDAYIPSETNCNMTLMFMDFLDEEIVTADNYSFSLREGYSGSNMQLYSVVNGRAITKYFLTDTNQEINLDSDIGGIDKETVENLTGIKYDAINTFLIYIGGWESVSDTEIKKKYSVLVNGTTNLQCKISSDYSESPNLENQLDNISRRFVSLGINNVYISNIIISDKEISADETIIELPISDTETDMMVDASGTYVAMADGEMLLQSIDTDTLISKCGAAIKLTNVIMVGDPAYRVGSEVNSATSITKLGDTITERNTYPLSTDSSSRIIDSWDASISIAALKKMQFGWKVQS